jgi:hypothetical protein
MVWGDWMAKSRDLFWAFQKGEPAEFELKA